MRVTLSHRLFLHVVAIAACVGACGGIVSASQPDASTGCPPGADIASQAAVGQACAFEGLFCPQPDCDPCSQNCRAVSCASGRWVAAVETGDCTDGAACFDIDVSTFDRSCNADADCMGIASGAFCAGQPSCLCPNAAVNVDGEKQWESDVQAVQTLGPPTMGCGCPLLGSPRCIANVCTLCGPSASCPDGG